MPESTPLIIGRWPSFGWQSLEGSSGRSRSVKRRETMLGPRNSKDLTKGLPEVSSWATRRTAVGLILGAPLLGACAGVQQSLSSFSNPFSSQQAGPAGPPQQPLAVGNGQVKVGLMLPLSAPG